jgi:hypothetical protein
MKTVLIQTSYLALLSLGVALCTVLLINQI